MTHNQAKADEIADEIAALEATMTEPVKNGTDASERKLTKIRLAEFEYAHYSALEANEALQPELAEVLAGPPDTPEAST